jgi:hypothetical protein
VRTSRSKEITMRCPNCHDNAAADISGIHARTFALGFAALIARRESTSKGDHRSFAEYGYAEALEDVESHGSPDSLVGSTCPSRLRRFSDSRSTRLARPWSLRSALGPPACSQSLHRRDIERGMLSVTRSRGLAHQWCRTRPEAFACQSATRRHDRHGPA